MCSQRAALIHGALTSITMCIKTLFYIYQFDVDFSCAILVGMVRSLAAHYSIACTDPSLYLLHFYPPPDVRNRIVERNRLNALHMCGAVVFAQNTHVCNVRSFLVPRSVLYSSSLTVEHVQSFILIYLFGQQNRRRKRHCRT